MNIYLCSTVRHLLFSLLKALSEPEKKQIIFMICDQQNIDENNFDKTVIPEHIEVIFIKRKILREEMYKGLKGKVIKLLANFNIQLSANIQQKLAVELFNKTLNLTLTKTQLSSAQLFLFNDRNKISRLFRLAFTNYSIIEDGMGNYRGFKLKCIEKLLLTLTASSQKMRYFGDDKRCQTIYLLDSKKAPAYIALKIEEITFINESLIHQYCLSFFKCKLIEGCPTIIATQPLAATGIDIIVYKKVIQKLELNGIDLVLKPHPSEDITRYQTNFPEIRLIDSKFPLELILFSSPQKNDVISLFSAAGMGFEKYCSRINLVKNNELNMLNKLFSTWRENNELITKRVDEVL